MTTTRKVNKAFNNIIHVPTPKPADACVHHWLIGSPPMQHGVCKHCGLERDQPMTYGLELAKVGVGKVTKSERFS